MFNAARIGRRIEVEHMLTTLSRGVVLPLMNGTRRVYVPLVLILAALVPLSCEVSDNGAGVGEGETNALASPLVFSATVEADLATLASTIPEAEERELDLEMALTLVAMPLSCLDRPHAAPRDRSTYLDTIVTSRRPGYERSRAFYGCWDWHSAVNSTWAIVRIYKEFPQLSLSGLITEKLDSHLSQEALVGELEFFEKNRTFERLYGWAWLLKLYAELRTWEHPESETWVDRVEPLATLFSERTVEYLAELKRPSRSGTHSNTAFALAMMLDASRSLGDTDLEEAIMEESVRLFEPDSGCPTAYEPWAADFLSPCLEEAALMALVLEADAYRGWFDKFLPPVSSREFLPLMRPIDPENVVESFVDGPVERDAAKVSRGIDVDATATEKERREADEMRALASTSHLIGLAFIRADALNRIASALAPGDARIPVYRKLAVLHGSMGFDAMFQADYAGSHWLGTFALKYLLTEEEP